MSPMKRPALGTSLFVLIPLLFMPLAGACGDDGTGPADSGSGDTGAMPTDSGDSDGALADSGGSPIDAGDAGDAGAGGDGGRDAGSPPSGTPRFVAVGYGTHRTTSDDGLSWENHQIVDPDGGDDPNLLRGVGWADGLFVAVGNQIMTSPDGVAWTNATVENSDRGFLSDAVYLDGVWVAAGGNGYRVRSVDGAATWTEAGSYFAGHFRALAAGNGIVIAVGHTYGGSPDTGLSAWTADGQTWSAERTEGARFGSIAFGNGVFVARTADSVSVTTDGESWQDYTLGADLEEVAFVNGEFVIADGTGFHRSPNGRDWTHVDGDRPPGALEFGVGRYVGTRWPGRMFASDGLTSWAMTAEMGPAITEIVLGYVGD